MNWRRPHTCDSILCTRAPLKPNPLKGYLERAYERVPSLSLSLQCSAVVCAIMADPDRAGVMNSVSLYPSSATRHTWHGDRRIHLHIRPSIISIITRYCRWPHPSYGVRVAARTNSSCSTERFSRPSASRFVRSWRSGSSRDISN